MFFFFFKQKTAYEMRISDWSSDVCSSDLPPAIGDMPDRIDVATPVRMRQPFAEVRKRATERAQQRLRIAARCIEPRFMDRETQIAAEIGRASWRERVGQYV